jgi:L-alanine-DL-glutamate epimerase-like enolase superfamily enzyme
MGQKSFMISQIKEKIDAGFDCIKIKIGSLDFTTELELIKNIRKEYSSKNLEIRVDANCAFTFSKALEKLKKLSDFSIHSIEQPIQTRQWEKMAFLCEKSPIAIALDEELINTEEDEKEKMLKTINPAYIILKPSLVGGLKKSEDWINVAANNNVKWWATSALESNIGLNAISQWVYGKSTNMKQGLGTGKLFSNNILSPYIIEEGHLKYFTNNKWDFSLFDQQKKLLL